jgi:triosephosphate isomerase
MKPLVVANWKMNPVSLAEAKKLFKLTRNRVVICPPFVYISALRAKGAQDCFWEEKGAYTGEISPSMLSNLGVEYVILGHSERRKYQKETNRTIEKKLKAVMKAGLRPILCIDKVSQIPKKIKRGYILAYEPLFAIGTEKPCDIEKARKMRNVIKKRVKVPLLYGGSVNSQNARDYIEKAGFDGLLVGGASLKPKEFIDIIKRVCYSK